MKAGIVSVHDTERILGTMESVRPVTSLCAMHYRVLQKQLLKAKAYVGRPHQIIHLSSKTITSLAWWVCCACFRSHQIISSLCRDLKDASLECSGGQSSCSGFFKRS